MMKQQETGSRSAVQLSIDTSCVNMAILTRYMPEGYALVSTDCIIRDGYVYVSVKKDVEIREAVLHITFETPNGEVVTTETVTAEGADGEDAVFRLGVDLIFQQDTSCPTTEIR